MVLGGGSWWSGLALGVGIVVDNSIVMLENIVKGHEQWRFQGSSGKEKNGNYS
ncbi:MAG: hypothetical protein GDA48_02280, partial [Hormoscilla sp. GM102CHS1]|nr:hypothetical protein [Hormoscilla sp. GM102CHS1]